MDIEKFLKSIFGLKKKKKPDWKYTDKHGNSVESFICGHTFLF